MTLRLSKENVFTRAGRKLGIDDVETGDPAFDREFYLKSNKPDFIRVALLPEIRHRLLAAWGKGLRGSLSADASEAKYAEQGSFSDNKLCARFTAAVELVCDVGEVVEACAE
jgi:hypothetical protein